MLCNFFVMTLQYFKSNILMAVWIFFFAVPTAQNSQKLKNYIRNMAQDTSDYYSVVYG